MLSRPRVNALFMRSNGFVTVLRPTPPWTLLEAALRHPAGRFTTDEVVALKQAVREMTESLEGRYRVRVEMEDGRRGVAFVGRFGEGKFTGRMVVRSWRAAPSGEGGEELHFSLRRLDGSPLGLWLRLKEAIKCQPDPDRKVELIARFLALAMRRAGWGAKEAREVADRIVEEAIRNDYPFSPSEEDEEGVRRRRVERFLEDLLWNWYTPGVWLSEKEVAAVAGEYYIHATRERVRVVSVYAVRLPKPIPLKELGAGLLLNDLVQT